MFYSQTLAAFVTLEMPFTLNVWDIVSGRVQRRIILDCAPGDERLRFDVKELTLLELFFVTTPSRAVVVYDIASGEVILRKSL